MSDFNTKVCEMDSSTQKSFRNGQLHTKKFPKWTAPHTKVSEMDSKKKFFFSATKIFFSATKKFFSAKKFFFPVENL